MSVYDIKMLVAEGCPHCAEAKEILKDKINSGQIKVMDIYEDESAFKIAQDLNVTGVPSMIVTDKVTKVTDVCQLAIDGKKIYCKDKEVNL